MITENGHAWIRGSEGDRCIRCQMRIEYYRAIVKASIEQPERDFAHALTCQGKAAIIVKNGVDGK